MIAKKILDSSSKLEKLGYRKNFSIIGIGLLMSLTHALADDWSNNAPLIANEVYLWHVSPEQREIADQNGRWLKDKLGVPLNQKRSISPS